MNEFSSYSLIVLIFARSLLSTYLKTISSSETIQSLDVDTSFSALESQLRIVGQEQGIRWLAVERKAGRRHSERWISSGPQFVKK